MGVGGGGAGTWTGRLRAAVGRLPPAVLLALFSLPLALLVLGLAVEQFHRQRGALLADLARTADDQRPVAQAVLADAGRTLGRLRNAMQAEIARRATADSPPPLRRELRLETATVAGRPLTALTLAEFNARSGGRGGALIGAPDLFDRSPATTRRADAGLALLDVMAVEHSVSPVALWSYFFSADADFITIHPAADLRALAEFAARSRPIATVENLARYWLSYDVFTLGTPSRNPERRPYWTRIYEDAGGAGRVISHGAPIDEGGTFLGVVGTDIPISAFEAAIAPMAAHPGLTAITGEGGDVLAVSATGAARTSALRRLATADVASEGELDRTSGGWALARAFPDTPFRLVYMVSDDEMLSMLLPRFAPYALIALGLAATFAGLMIFLHRAYVAPSHAVAAYVAAEATGRPFARPQLSGVWSDRFDAFARAFAASRDYRRRLEANEARFQAAAASLSDGFAIVDADRKLAVINDRFADYVEPTARGAVALGSTLGAALGPAFADDAPTVSREIRLSDGRWIDIRVNPMPDGGATLLLSDVTDARTAEISLRESAERYRAVVNTQTELVARFCPDGRTTFVNDAYCRHMGMTAEELTDPRMDGFMHLVPDDVSAHEAHIRSLTPDNPTATVVFRAILPDGSLHWEEWTDTGLFAADGTLVEMQSVGRDVTAKREAEEAFRASEARMAAFLEHAPVAMMATDRDGRYVMANPEAARRLRRPAQDIIGRTVADLLPPEEAATADHAVARVLATGVVDVEEASHPSLAPHVDNLFIRFPLKDGAGAVTGVGVFAVDQTQQKAIEAELERQRAAGLQNEKLAALGSLLAGVAHELNNPLSIVVGYSGMLRELAPDEATRRRAEEINKAADRCARIVKSFLAMARSKPAERRDVDIEDVLDSVLELAGYGLRRAGVRVERTEGERLPLVSADPDQIHQVLMNLVLNAQHALEGRADPTLRIETALDGGDVRVRVADNGCGMDAEVRQRAFEPFFTTKPQGVGTGVGLSVCHGVVTAHGGTMELDSSPGLGSRFDVRLPASAGAAAAAPGETAAVALQGSLLVVDDEPAIVAFVRQALSGVGLEVATARSAAEALALLDERAYDALLTDLRMPGMTGERLIEAAVARRPALSGHIVAMTGDALGTGLPSGSNVVVLEKPLELGALRAALAGVLDRGTTPTPERAP